MATYGDFPGVKVTTQSGGVPSVTIGEEEKVLLFGEANYDDATNEVAGDDSTKSAVAEDPEQINAPQEADSKFGSDSELAEAMKEALANGANIDYLYGVAVSEVEVTGETQGSQSGTLDNYNLKEDVSTITFDDDGTSLSVEFRYAGAPNTPGDANTVFINPLTGEYAADAAPTSDFSVDYEYHDYQSAFEAEAVGNVVNEDETGIYWALTDSDKVSSDLDTVVSTLRDDYQLVNAFTFAEPNDNELLDTVGDTDGGADPRYDTANYSAANQSVTAEYFYKPAPARTDGDDNKTIGGGLAGLYAGKPINDAIYNEVVSGYQSLEQSLTKTEADELRAESIIPVRSAGSVRVRGNRSTAFGEADTVAADFWTRRIADRVILIGKLVGDEILGRINDERTRESAQRVIEAQMRNLVAERLIKPNTDEEQYWRVDVYEDSTNSDEVNIDIYFTPYGIAKRIDETITVNT